MSIMRLHLLKCPTLRYTVPFTQQGSILSLNYSTNISINNNRLLLHGLRNASTVTSNDDISAKPSKPQRKRRKVPTHLNLEYFIETAKSRQLWRFIVRATYRLPSASQRQELLAWARTDFERHRLETDPQKIKYLVSRGTKEVNDMAKYLALPTVEFNNN